MSEPAIAAAADIGIAENSYVWRLKGIETELSQVFHFGVRRRDLVEGRARFRETFPRRFLRPLAARQQ